MPQKKKANSLQLNDKSQLKHFKCLFFFQARIAFRNVVKRSYSNSSLKLSNIFLEKSKEEIKNELR